MNKTTNTVNPYGDELCGVCHYAIDNQGLCVIDASHTRSDLEPSGKLASPQPAPETRDLTHNPGATQAYAELDAALTEEDKQLIIGAIPLQALPDEYAEQRAAQTVRDHSSTLKLDAGDWRVEPLPTHGWRVVDATGQEIVADVYRKEDAEQIVAEHNALPRLVEALQRRVSPTKCYCNIMLGAKCGECADREMLAALRRSG